MREVILSKRASQKLEKLLQYLEKEWSVKTRDNFIKKLDKSFEQLKKFPESSMRSELKKGLHRSVVTKQTSVFYHFDEKSIKVVTIFDNRMDPKKLKTELK
ncbi:MAG: type II toxin-antitoxin system RelE/ParE family toxin [Mariniphaga sp.]|nr:type II toxin-antitoxin system RelE/ParE family toxin [Mariniphaga sp.]